MTYDLRRLRLNGLIRRLPHTNRHVLTADGVRIAVFYTKIYNRLQVPPEQPSGRAVSGLALAPDATMLAVAAGRFWGTRPARLYLGHRSRPG